MYLGTYFLVRYPTIGIYRELQLPIHISYMPICLYAYMPICLYAYMPILKLIMKLYSPMLLSNYHTIIGPNNIFTILLEHIDLFTYQTFGERA